MDDELVDVTVVTRTGQRTQFKASAAERQKDGYKFFSFPERRGYKKLIVVKDDAIATISIEAPEPFFLTLADAPSAPAIHPAAALGAIGVVPPTATGAPVDYVALPQAARLDGAVPRSSSGEDPRTMRQAIPVKTDNGSPASVVQLMGRQVAVSAAMLAGPPRGV